ncbi:MAG: hypothetical protein AAFV53_23095 [Myxococcota bacterium]
MVEPEELVIIRISTIIACVIVMLGWLVAAGLGVVMVRRQVAVVRQRAGGMLDRPQNSALLMYILSAFFWPAGFILGLYFLNDPKTALQGRNCLYIGIGYITLITGLTCLGMAALGMMYPELIARFTP